MGTRWYPLVLTCISLMGGEVEDHRMCSLAICLSSLERYLVKPLARVLIGLFDVLWLSYDFFLCRDMKKVFCFAFNYKNYLKKTPFIK